MQRWGIAFAAATLVWWAAVASPALAHGDDVAVVVEARAADPSDALHTDYAFTLTFADGDVVRNAVVRASAALGEETVEPLAVDVVDDTYLVHMAYPTAGTWTLDVAVDHPDVQIELSLIETIPLGDPGTQLVRLDTADESRVGLPGTLVIPDHPLATPPQDSTTSSTSPTEAPAETGGSEITTSTTEVPSTTTTISAAATSPPAAETGSHGAMVQVTTTGALSLPAELLLRWAHLGAITVWGLAILGLAIRLPVRLLPAASLVGLAATLATGLLLGLWGTPVGYPGIFRWSDLGVLEYGASWQASFVVKMGAVVVAVVGTSAAIRRRGWGAVTAAAGMGLALIVVTALSQFHLLTHG